MTAGIQITGSGGDIIIDQGYRNLFLLQKGGSAPSGTLITAYSSTANHDYVGGVYVTNSYSTEAAKDPVSGSIVHSTTSSSGITPYYFGLLNKTPTSKYGLQVFNPDTGALCFDALQKPLRYVTKITSSGSSFTKKSGKVYAIIYGGMKYRYVRGAIQKTHLWNNFTQNLATGWNPSGSTISLVDSAWLNWQITWENEDLNGASITDTSGTPSLFVIDVTGY